MAETFTDDRRPRMARNLVALLLAALSTFASAAIAAGATESSPPGADASLFRSEFGYTLALPPGWTVLVAEVDPAGGEDLFSGPEGTARVGGAPVEPGDTVDGRVAANREEITGAGTCQSDPADDRPTTLDGEVAIAWTWRCEDSSHTAINTIHDGLRLRLQVNVPVASETEAAPLLEALREGFTFVDDPTSPSGDLATVEAALQGTWENAWHPRELEFATLEAAGIDFRDSDWFAFTSTPTTTTRAAVKFQDSAIVQYGAVEGGPLEVGWVGTYRLLDDHTIEATESSTFNVIVYEFTLRDDVLTIDMVSNDDPLDVIPQTAIYETLPFTRLP